MHPDQENQKAQYSWTSPCIKQTLLSSNWVELNFTTSFSFEFLQMFWVADDFHFVPFPQHTLTHART